MAADPRHGRSPPCRARSSIRARLCRLQLPPLCFSLAAPAGGSESASARRARGLEHRGGASERKGANLPPSVPT